MQQNKQQELDDQTFSPILAKKPLFIPLVPMLRTTYPSFNLPPSDIPSFFASDPSLEEVSFLRFSSSGAPPPHSPFPLPKGTNFASELYKMQMYKCKGNETIIRGWVFFSNGCEGPPTGFLRFSFFLACYFFFVFCFFSVVHGGALATILDMASGLAVLSLFGFPLSSRGYHLFTTKLDVSYVSFSPLGDYFIVEAKMQNQRTKKGKTYHTIESRISRVSSTDKGSSERSFLASLATGGDLASDVFLSQQELTLCASSIAEFVSRGEVRHYG